MDKFVGSPTPKTHRSAEYWAAKGDVKLYVYRKRLLAPERDRSATSWARNDKPGETK